MCLIALIVFFKKGMAKSLRSKRQRKMRAIKRERYGQKELAKLKSILGLDGCSSNSDVIMENVADLVTG